ncbi:MAG: hypothetical protein Kow00121_68160 [Elainellaceae cyanobacterium]
MPQFVYEFWGIGNGFGGLYVGYMWADGLYVGYMWTVCGSYGSLPFHDL